MSETITFAEQIHLQRADQVGSKSADKSVNAGQVLAPSCDKSTQVNQYHGLSPEEQAKIEQAGKEARWIKYGVV